MKKILVLLLALTLYGCNSEKSPLDIATSYLEEMYDSSSYEELLGEDFDLEERIQAVIAAPFSTEEAIQDILVTGLIPVESIYLNGYEFEVTEIAYNELEKDTDDVYYIYKVTVEITDPDGIVTEKEVEGELNLTMIDETWKIHKDKLKTVNWDIINKTE